MSPSPQRVTVSEAIGAARDTRCLELGRGVLGRTPQVFQQQFGDKPVRLVADTNTFAAAGRYPVTLTTADAIGNTSTATSTITISPQRPAITSLDRKSVV
jgi:hypothetical protein